MMLPDNFTSAGRITPSVGGQQCTETTLTQPCDWAASPELLSSPIYRLPPGEEDQDLPFQCAPGILGSANVEEQQTSICAGLCPSGKLCPGYATVIAVDCEQGKYCPAGSAVAIP
eukprot:2000775-Prymnesium_polylepis.1